jgi:hypothetical protein
MTWIITALLLTSCDDAPLSQNMNPINTVPILFNCYFDTNIILRREISNSEGRTSYALFDTIDLIISERTCLS